MAGMRVHELAKEFGMTSKDLLARLQGMGIPAKNHASTLVDAYVDKIRKDMGPELAERAAALEAVAVKEAAKAEEEVVEKAAAEQVARKKAMEEERARREAEKRQRDDEARVQAEAEAAEAEKNMVPKDTAPHSVPAFGGLLAQIEEERTRLEAERTRVEAERKAAAVAKKTERHSASHEGSRAATATSHPAAHGSTQTDPHKPAVVVGEAAVADKQGDKQSDKRTDKKPEKKFDRKSHRRPAEGEEDAAMRHGTARRPHGHEAGTLAAGVDEKSDRYTLMAEVAEKLQRDRVLEEARSAVAAAQEEGKGRRKKRKEKRASQAAAEEQEKIEKKAAAATTAEGVVQIPTSSTVGEVADLLTISSNEIIKRLFLLGTPLTVNQVMGDDLIELMATDLGREVKILSAEEEMVVEYHDDPADLVPRPPVVTVMGHVDHGKTSLLDAIRSTGVVETEAGGITQHIGASVVNINGRQITFIDTPGHEAFTAMRARGAQITDVIVLVVAADDGVMPQTVEAINHAKAAKVPIVVAVNKIDKPGANPDRVRQELVERGIVPEEWGGTNMFMNVSAKKKIGIDDLLETILLQADVLELKANPKAQASGYVIEAKLDKGRGPVATVLVDRGTLRKGDIVVVGTSYGRVRMLIDPKGRTLSEASPSDPVEIVGLGSVPDAGDEFRVMEDEREARSLAEERSFKQRRLAEQAAPHMSLDDLFKRIDEGTTELNLVVKADVQGSIEALQDALGKMDQSEVKINVVHSAVGGITETDVTLAAASDAIIIGFGVRPQPKAKVAAEKEKVDIRTYRIIYQAIEDINAARVGLLAPEFIDHDTATAEVRDLFRVPKIGVIAGCYITDGELTRDDKVRVVRDGTIVYEGTISSLRRFKDDVKTVKQGYECGVGIEGFQDIKEGDIIEGYRTEEVARKE